MELSLSSYGQVSLQAVERFIRCPLLSSGSVIQPANAGSLTHSALKSSSSSQSIRNVVARQRNAYASAASRSASYSSSIRGLQHSRTLGMRPSIRHIVHGLHMELKRNQEDANVCAEKRLDPAESFRCHPRAQTTPSSGQGNESWRSLALKAGIFTGHRKSGPI